MNPIAIDPAVDMRQRLKNRRIVPLLLLMALPFIPACSETPESNSSLDNKTSSVTTTNSSRSPQFADFSSLDSEEKHENASLEFTTFTETTTECGIDFTYDNGASPQVLMVETTGGGCGWIDFDLDGYSDLYFVQGGNPTASSTDAQPNNCLYRNLGGQEFVEVTIPSGAGDRSYGQGIAVGDYDNDGFDDIYLTNVGADYLFQNQGDGTFRRVETQMTRDPPEWSSSAAWGDLDRDGDLDLYVAHYADYAPRHPKLCFRTSGEPATCHPKDVDPSPDRCYRNNGDGTFDAVEQQWGLYGEGNRALGVAILDFNLDGWADLYVANDTTENFLFINQEGNGFKNLARFLGCAVNSNGSPQASMGIAVGDYDANGYIDLYLSHFHDEWNTLYQNLGESGYRDVTTATGLAFPTMNKLGFGTIMEDYDHDGQQELIVVNGHIDDVSEGHIDYEMTTQYFSFNGRSWEECSTLAGDFFLKKILGRGLAQSDYDNDGDFDLAIVSQNSPAALLRNNSQGNAWLKIGLIGQSSNRHGIGSYVYVSSDEHTWTKTLAGGTSFCSSHESVLIFGLGQTDESVDVKVQWPNGHVQQIDDVRVNQVLTITESQ